MTGLANYFFFFYLNSKIISEKKKGNPSQYSNNLLEKNKKKKNLSSEYFLDGIKFDFTKRQSSMVRPLGFLIAHFSMNLKK